MTTSKITLVGGTLAHVSQTSSGTVTQTQFGEVAFSGSMGYLVLNTDYDGISYVTWRNKVPESCYVIAALYNGKVTTALPYRINDQEVANDIAKYFTVAR